MDVQRAEGLLAVDVRDPGPGADGGAAAGAGRLCPGPASRDGRDRAPGQLPGDGRTEWRNPAHAGAESGPEDGRGGHAVALGVRGSALARVGAARGTRRPGSAEARSG